MAAILRLKLRDPVEWRDCALLAKRYNASEALRVGLVDAVAKEAELKSTAMEMVPKLAKIAGRSGPIYGRLKQALYRELVECVKEDSTIQVDMRKLVKL